ncbi:MAG: alpha/beta hydrolase, partial [Synechococcaceae cyanobacterium]|nr:alpha/beta hydrolase [Synechococcaceae cyanobacterium]
MDIIENNRIENELDLKYIKIGKGNKTGLAFHGFGQDNSYYEPFESVYGDKYTIYAFNLPYHGDDKTPKSGIPAAKATLKDFFEKFFDNKGISRFTNIGFSIGAKISLALLELFPDKTEELILIAPDGIRANMWYQIGTGSMVTRSLFKYFVNHPELFFRFSGIISSMGLVHPGVLRFAKSQMNTIEKRERVYYTWMFFRKLRSRKNRVKDLLSSHKIPVSVFLGKEDKIIPEKYFKFLKDNKINSNIILLNAGHNDL